jgi:hypothetical protein
MPTVLGLRREGSGTLATRGGRPVYEDTINYIVQADYQGQPRYEITTTAGLPVPGITKVGIAFCKSVKAVSRREQGLIYDVACEFSSEVEEGQGDTGDNQNGPQPEAWVPIYETKSISIQEPATEDKDGTAYANSMGDPFETGLLLTRILPVWDFYQFEAATISDETILERKNTINASTFKGRAAKTLLLDVESTIGRYYGRKLRLNHYTLTENKKTWTAKRLDIGLRYDDGTVKAFTQDGVPYLGALDGTGDKQPDGTAPAILEFDEFETSTFSFLRL